MQRVWGLTVGQRVVLVIGLGLLFAVVGAYVATDGFRATGGGWFAYAPGTDVYFSVRRPSRVRTLVVPLGLVVVWTLVSTWLLGSAKDNA